MTKTTALEPAISQAILRFELNPNAHRIGSDAEALAVARELAAEFAIEAAERDREIGAMRRTTTRKRRHGAKIIAVHQMANR